MGRKNLKIHSNLTLSELLREVNLNEDDDEKLGAELEKAFTDAISSSMEKFSELGKDANEKVKDTEEVKAALAKAPELKQLATESIRKMNKMMVENNVRGKINEEITLLFLASSAIILPALAQLVGIIANKIAKILTNTLNVGGSIGKLGDASINFGKKMQSKVIGLIRNGLNFIPGYKKLPIDVAKSVADILNLLITCAVFTAEGISDAIAVGVVGVVKGIINAEQKVIEDAINAVKSGTQGIIKFIRTQLKERLA